MLRTHSRLDLHEKLKSILGANHVYFQPPESIKMKYPAIVYSLSDIKNLHSGNKVYEQFTSYQVTVIDQNPDSEIYKEISKLPMCRFNRFYVADNLNHYSFTLYY